MDWGAGEKLFRLASDAGLVIRVRVGLADGVVRLEDSAVSYTRGGGL